MAGPRRGGQRGTALPMERVVAVLAGRLEKTGIIADIKNEAKCLHIFRLGKSQARCRFSKLLLSKPLSTISE